MAAARQAHEAERSVILALAAAKRRAIRARNAMVAAFRSGKDPARAAVDALREALEPVIRDAVTHSTLAGRAAANEEAPAVAAAQTTAYDQAIGQLRRRLLLTPAELAALELAVGRHVLTVLAEAAPAIQRKLQAVLLEITQEGMHVREGVARLRRAWRDLGLAGGNAWQLETIFRTQTQLAYAAGRREQEQRPEIQRILWGYKYVTAGDDRVRPTHVALDGVTLPKDDPWWAENTPPNGWNCFAGDTLVSGSGLLWVSRARYAGQMVELETVGGHRLSVTVNHPIATCAGWRRAGEIKAGDRVLSDSRKVEFVQRGGGPQMAGRTVYKEDAPTRLNEAFDALAAQGRGTISPAAVDFHGEAEFFVGQVDVVWADGELVDQFTAASGEEFQRKRPLPRPNLALVGVDGHGRCASFGEGSNAAKYGLLGGPALPRSRRLIHAGPLYAFGFGRSANHSAVSREQTSNGPAGSADSFRDAVHGLAAHVGIDQIRSVRRFEFDGHVYDLQSRCGAIVAGGIVASNCRCQVIPLYGPRKIVQPPRVVTVDGKPVNAGADPGFRFNPGRLIPA